MRTSTPADVPILILAFMAGVGTLMAVDWPLAQQRLFGLVFGLATFFATVSCVWRLGRLALPLGGLALGAHGIAIAVFGLVGTAWNTQKLPVLAPLYEHLPHLRPAVDASTGTEFGLHANELGGMLTLVLPVCLAVFLWSARWQPLRVASGLTSALLLFVLSLSLSRSAYVGAAVGIILLIFLRAPRRWGLMTLIVGLAAILLVSTGSLRGMDLLAGQDASPIVSGMTTFQVRLEIWKRAILLIQDFPLTGSGLNSFPIVLDAAYPFFSDGTVVHAPHAHNLFLQAAIDFGIPGLMSFIWITGVVARCWWQSWHSADAKSDFISSQTARPSAAGLSLEDRARLRRAVLAGLLAGITGYLVYGLTDAVTIGAKPGYLVWMTYGLIVASPMSASAERPGYW